MAPLAFQYGPRLILGEGCSSRLVDVLPDGPVLIVTDQHVSQLEAAKAAFAEIALSRRTVVFAAVEADPSLPTLEAAIALGSEARVASVVGFGGGSPMDVAKLAAYLLGSGDALDKLWGVDKAIGRGLPLVLVPTTAGTGSEATPISIIRLPDGEKRGVSASPLIASHAILDPSLTVQLPASVTAATGMDAIVHAVEAYTSAHLKNPISDMLAREALRLLAENLLIACGKPSDIAARSAMLLGAHLAGVAFANAPVAGVHALAYPLGGRFHVSHGLSNVLLLPHVLRFNMQVAMPLYAELGPIVDPTLTGLGQRAQAAGLIDALSRLSANAGMPQRLRDVGIADADLNNLAADAMRQERLLRNNPRPITEADARLLYEAAL